MRRFAVHGLCGLVFICLIASGALLAQAGSQTGAATASSPAPRTGQDPNKKVWTNEDVAGLRDNTTIPTFSGSKAKAPASATRAANPRGRDAKWYHDEIAKLQAQVPPLNDQIAALQAALDGKPAGDEKTSTRPYGVGLKIDTWTDERDQLTKKRDRILAQIENLRDEARHNGIPDSALP